MSMTISEKILARAAGNTRVQPGDVVVASYDLAVILDKVGAHVVKAFEDMGAEYVRDPGRVVINHDMIPPSTVKTAENQRVLTEFAHRHQLGIGPYGEGIYHDVLVQLGRIRPGQLIIVTDSHAVTLGAYGTFTTGVGISDMAMALETGELWFKVPSTLRYEMSGIFPPGTC